MNDSPALGYVIIYVPDVLASLKFFKEGLGLTEKMVHESCEYAELQTGPTVFALAHESAYPGESKKPLARSGFELAFVTSDVAALQERALRAGASLVAELSEKPWGQTVGYISSPAGTLIEICTPVS